VRAGSSQLDVDFGRQRPVDRAARCGFHQHRAMLIGQRSLKFDLNFNPIDHPVLRHAVFAIFSVNTRLPQRYGDTVEGYISFPRLPPNCH